MEYAFGVFTATEQCMWDILEINYSANVHGNKATCHPV